MPPREYHFWVYIRSAIKREKELKHWTRDQKIARIESSNPTWDDLAAILNSRFPSGMTERKTVS